MNDNDEYKGYLDKIVSEIYNRILKSGEENIIEITGMESFTKFISSGSSVIVFYNPNCPVCKRFMPVYEEYVASKRSSNNSVKYGKINTTKKDNIIISIIYGVYAVPTIALFRDGKIIARHEGYMNREELEEFIDKELYANQDNHE